MNKYLSKIVGAVASLALVIGVGVGIANDKKTNAVEAAAESGVFEKVTSSTLTVGDIVIFVNAEATKALGDLSATSSGYGSPISVTPNASGKISLTNSTTVTQFTVEAGATSGYAFKAKNNTNYENYYLAYTSTATSKSNYLNRYATNTTGENTQAQFTLSYGTTMAVRSVYNSGRWLRFNSDRFACYYKADSESTTGSGVDIYKKVSSTPEVSVSKTSLFFRIGGEGQTVTASSLHFSGAVTYSWTYLSGTDCVDLANESTATVTMTPKSGVLSPTSGVYKVTASYSTEVATANVTVIIDKGGSSTPYTVSEARAAIDSGVGLTNAYARGVVYQIDSYSAKYHSITYWISDDGSNSNPLEVYGGLNIEGGDDFASKDDIKLGDIVVVTGNLTKYSSTYEFEANNHLVSKISVASIAIKTAPTKTAYNSSEYFDPTGLVVTATYDDTPDPTTKDFAYSALTSAFSFDPDTDEALTDQDSISITLFGKSTSQAITLTIRTITGVTLLGDMTKKSYCVGDSWNLTGLYLSISWNVGSPNPTTVNLVDLEKGSDYSLDSDTASFGINSLRVSGTYEEFAFEKTVTGITVAKKPVQDILRTAATSLNLTDSSYTAFSGKTNTLADINSGATWAGLAAYNSGKNGSLQLNGTTRGIYTTASRQFVKSVSVDFYDANSKSLYFYGSNTAYTAINESISEDENSTLIATLSSSTTSANISGDYKYLYIYSSGALYMNSITITWGFASNQIENTLETQASLTYHYSKDNTEYTYSNVGIRFTGRIDATLWNTLNAQSTIEGYGIMYAETSQLAASEIEEWYDLARASAANVDASFTVVAGKSYKMVNDSEVMCYYTAVPGEKEHPAQVGDEYVWSLFKSIDTSNPSTAEANLAKQYTAVAYIRTSFDEIIFLDEITRSAADIALELYLADASLDDTLNGSLSDLANMA